MTYFQALILAIIEGLTEFIPVSSTANLLLADKFLNISHRELFTSFVIFIQLGAMLAVFELFWREFWQHKNLWPKIISAFIPTAIIGFLVYPIFKTYLQNASLLTGWVLIIGGLFFSALDYYWWQRDKKKAKAKTTTYQTENIYLQEIEKTSLKKMALLGIGQAIAILPGVSRSAASIFSARALGLSQKAATKFSFLIALPTIAAAVGLDLLQEGYKYHQLEDQKISLLTEKGNWLILIFGILVAFVVSRLTIKFFMRFLGEKRFYWWGIYRLIIGLLWLGFFS